MILIRTLFVVTFLVLTGFSAAQFRAIPIEMEIEDNIIFVTLNINGKAAQFLVDTGASISVIDYKKAEAYRFEFHPEAGAGRIYSVGGNSEFSLTSRIAVAYQDTNLRNMRFYASDIDDLNRYLLKKEKEILGIIGSDFLWEHQAVIDYGEKVIYIKSK